MVEEAPISTILPTVEAGPPTPPREPSFQNDGSTLLGRWWSKTDPSLRQASIHSIVTSDSSVEKPNLLSGSARKRVEWSDWTDPKELPSIVRPLPPSADQKPTKSILKAHNASYDTESPLGRSTKLLPPHQHENFATMLESITQQLAGRDRNSKMDAYLMLSGSLKASDNVPDVKALEDKMDLLLSFIRRDLDGKTENGKTDSSLVINALVLFSSFLHKSAIAKTITTEFAVFIVDRAIQTFEEGQTSKEIVKYLMFVMAQQNFSPKVMTTERVSKLIGTLHLIEPINLKGKSIITQRINIYRTLLRQSRTNMLANTGWVLDLFTTMISAQKETRAPAVAFGLEAAYSLGSEAKASRTVSNVFSLEHKDKRRYAEFYADRLKHMVKEKKDPTTALAVPQIWSVIILFLRGRSKQLEQWAYFGLFREVLQDCFNSSDHALRKEALRAWDKFVFAVQPNDKTTRTLIKLLAQLPLAMLKRSSKSHSLRIPTLNSVYCLLYYSFNPTASSHQLDLFWDEYIVPIVGRSLTPVDLLENIERSTQDLVDACVILQNLFDSSRSRKWDSNKIMDNFQQSVIEVQDLPALDSKWLRKNALRVFPILSPLVEKLFWGLGSEDSNITILWKTYIKSIASPAAMEVKVSNDTMASIAALFGQIYRIWHLGPLHLSSLPIEQTLALQYQHSFLKCFESIITIALNGLGILAFTERHLCIGTEDNSFIPIATPSQQPKKLRGQVKLPLYHLFALLTMPSPGLRYSDDFLRMVHAILAPFFQARKTRTSKIGLAKNLIDQLPPEQTDACKLIWQAIASFVESAVDSRDKQVNTTNEQPLGADYRDVIQVLGRAVKLEPSDALRGSRTLFEALVSSASIDAGDAGRAIAVIEPFAKACLDDSVKVDDVPHGAAYFSSIIGKATYPRDYPALYNATRAFWETSYSATKHSSFDPYNDLYQYLQLCLQASYNDHTIKIIDERARMISATASLLGRCPDELVLKALARIQKGIACWIQDSEAKVQGGNPLSQAIMSLWNKICDTLVRFDQPSALSGILEDLEILICAGLQSRHRTIVNSTIKMWNLLFGSAEALRYPERVQSVLLILHSKVIDLRLPTFPIELENKEFANLHNSLELIETQDSTNYFGSSGLGSSLSAPQLEGGRKSLPLKSPTPQFGIDIFVSGRKRICDATPETGPRKARRLASKLRHEDSQIQFEAIDSSPITDRVLDLQILTKRQKEVKERQDADAAMFPDLKVHPGLGIKSPTLVTADPELPIHRSPSKYGIASLVEQRQTTPVLILASDDDNFVTSSPTPTRSVRDDIEQERLSPNFRKVDTIRFDEDMPSSPPEHIDFGLDTASSVDPSAQLDPWAIHHTLSLSTAENAMEPRESTPTLATGLPEPASIRQVEGDLERASSEDPDPQISRQLFDEAAIQRAVTPLSVKESLIAPQTPTTPQFVDAPSTPVASSDDLFPVDEVFENAVSSPRFDVGRRHPPGTFSPSSEIDASSMMRVMAEFDEDVRVNTERRDAVVQKPETKLRETRKVSTSSPQPSPRSIGKRKVTLSTTPLAQTKLEQTDGQMEKMDFSMDRESETSSIASLIPETPAVAQVVVTVTKTKIDVDGEQFNPDDTILVDDSLMNDDDQLQISSEDLGSKTVVIYAKKRVLWNTSDDKHVVPDSQELRVEIPVRASNNTPSKKKKKTSPRKIGRTRQTGDLSQESQSNNSSAELQKPAQEDTSIDLGLSQIPGEAVDKEMINEESVPDEISTSVQQLVDEENLEEESFHSGSYHSLETFATNKPQKMLSRAEEIQNRKYGETEHTLGPFVTFEVHDMSLNDSSLIKPISLPVESEVKENGLHGPCTSATLQSGISAPLLGNPHPETCPPACVHESEMATAQGSVAEVDGPSVTTVKAQLRKLILNMQTASLTRDEVSELEDMFMDAKGLLYEAGKRGRGSLSDM